MLNNFMNINRLNEYQGTREYYQYAKSEGIDGIKSLYIADESISQYYKKLKGKEVR